MDYDFLGHVLRHEKYFFFFFFFFNILGFLLHTLTIGNNFHNFKVHVFLLWDLTNLKKYTNQAGTMKFQSHKEQDYQKKERYP